MHPIPTDINRIMHNMKFTQVSFYSKLFYCVLDDADAFI